jgi:hypothetical protein
MRRRIGFLFFTAASACCAGATGADRWTVEGYGGNAYDFRNRLSIAQERTAQSLNAKADTGSGLRVRSLDRAYRAGDWTYRFGAGPVITHAEATINGLGYDAPYKRPGAALLAGGGWRLYVGSATFLSLEALFTVARSNPAVKPRAARPAERRAGRDQLGDPCRLRTGPRLLEPL